MARLVKHTALGPSLVMTKSGDEVWICRCGLTADPNGECDKTHKKLLMKLRDHPEDDKNLACYDPGKRDEDGMAMEGNVIRRE